MKTKKLDKKKKNFNNLQGSVFLLLLLVLCIAIIVLFIYLCSFYVEEDTFLIYFLVCIGFTFLFTAVIVVISYVLITSCFDYWYIEDDHLIYKQLSEKKNVIPLKENYTIKKRRTKESNGYDAYQIYYKDQEALVCITAENKDFLKNLLERDGIEVL